MVEAPPTAQWTVMSKILASVAFHFLFVLVLIVLFGS